MIMQNTVDLRTNESGDWFKCLVNGTLVTEGHSFKIYDAEILLEHLGVAINREEVPDDEL